MQDEDIELLRVNYQNLHTSVWDAHKVAWIAISIFLPILFGIQGYFIKEYDKFSIFQVVMGAVVILSLVFIWWLMMRILEQYNKARIKRLRKIENVIDKTMSNYKNVHRFQQYKGLDYTLRIKGIKITPMRIYNAIVIVCLIINVVLVCTKALQP